MIRAAKSGIGVSVAAPTFILCRYADDNLATTVPDLIDSFAGN
jgi:hypothetical protein